ncbi:MAG: hypothetical protein E7A62_03280 [Actinomycetaceae bacterium]|nr:hypothetical protein [Actinomycetaceae bacterium]MDU0970006.1 hypothetical protein [Actinomycetaceae bacterium]
MTDPLIPDRSVRFAVVEDAGALGAVQAASMAEAVRAGLDDPTAPIAFDADQIAASWREGIAHPPSRTHRVLVALERATVSGFAAIGPFAADIEITPDGPMGDQLPDIEIVALEIDPPVRDFGHADRLINAIGDTTRAMGAKRVAAWAVVGDDFFTELLAGAGFAPAGVARTLDVGERTITQHLWYTDL